MLANLVRRPEQRDGSSGTGAMSWPDYLRLWEQFGFNGVTYVLPSGGIAELTAVQAQRNPIVWACVAFRLLVFSEVRFAYQRWQAGRPGPLFGTQDLALLEEPWPKATTGDLLARMEVDASFFGNSYWTVAPSKATATGKQMIRMKPTHISIATLDTVDLDTGETIGRELVGYTQNDPKTGQPINFFLPEEVAHYRPLPDPQHEFRGVSWLNSLLPDVIADLDMSDFKHSFLKNAATPALVVSFANQMSQEAFNKFRDRLESAHTGPQAGFKTLYLGAGADVKVVGSNLKDVDLTTIQGAGETRIASAAGVPPSLISLSEGMKGSALNSGNYAATRRRFSDGTMRPLWRMACGSLAPLVKVPGGARLWYDPRDVPFLQEDETEAANIRQADAKTALLLIQAGYEPATVTAAVQTGDFSQLAHTGLISVQLQHANPPIPPGGSPQPTDPMLPVGDEDDEEEGD